MSKTESPWVRRTSKGGGWELKVSARAPGPTGNAYWVYARAARVLKKSPKAWQMFLLGPAGRPTRCIGERPTKELAMAVCEAVVAMEGS